MPAGAGRAAALHAREDEYSFVLEGCPRALLGEHKVFTEPGDLVFKPRGQWHTFWNAGDRPARILEIISPAGLEELFREFGSAGLPEPDTLTAMAARYGAELGFERTAPGSPSLPSTAMDPDFVAWSTRTAEEEMEVSVREVRAAGLEALMLATELLQRARRADPQAGLWEAADVQWWWRRPRLSDEVEKLFWIDDEGPVAGVLLTSWTDDAWQCDPVVVPRASVLEPGVVWRRAIEHVAKHSAKGFEVPVRDDDRTFQELAQRSGLTAGEQDSTAWMGAADRPAVPAPSEGFVLIDRTQRRDAPHPMRHRNGDSVAQRLDQCPLYDPSLDLAVETADGRVAGYSLYWFDPTTKVGLVEPVRVEDEFQRHGLARAMLSAGLDRLVTRGAQRVKIAYETDAAAALYRGVGFRRTSTATWYRALSE